MNSQARCPEADTSLRLQVSRYRVVVQDDALALSARIRVVTVGVYFRKVYTVKTTKVHPAVFFSIIAAAAAIALYFGFTIALAPPHSAIGINRDGTEMTRAQADKLADAMSGGRFSKMRDGGKKK